MATALTVIVDALKEIGVLADEETPSAGMSNDALRALNRIFEVLSNGQSFAYSPVLLQRSLTGAASFTIGATGDVATTRPIAIESAYATLNGINSAVRVLDNQQWDSIPDKSTTGSVAEYIWFESTLPNAIVHVYPLASGSTLNMRVTTLVASFPNLSSAVTLPPGYEECMIKNLAVNIAPQYSVIPSPLTVAAATASMKAIKKTNRIIPKLTLPGIVTNNRGGSYASFISGG